MISTAPLKISGTSSSKSRRIRSGCERETINCGPRCIPVDLDQVDLDALPGAVALGRHLLPGRHHRLGLAQLDDDRA